MRKVGGKLGKTKGIIIDGFLCTTYDFDSLIAYFRMKKERLMTYTHLGIELIKSIHKPHVVTKVTEHCFTV